MPLLSYFCCKQKYLIVFAGPQNCYDKYCENGKTLRRVTCKRHLSYGLVMCDGVEILKGCYKQFNLKFLIEFGIL